jgi:hypothetical protein
MHILSLGCRNPLLLDKGHWLQADLLTLPRRDWQLVPLLLLLS